jgi:hypothetical protein
MIQIQILMMIFCKKEKGDIIAKWIGNQMKNYVQLLII